MTPRLPASLLASFVLLPLAPIACGGGVDRTVDIQVTVEDPVGAPATSSATTASAQPAPTAAPSSASSASPTPSASAAAPTPAPTTGIVDPAWQRTNEYFLAPAAPHSDLQYYADNTYPLYDEDNSLTGAGFTWTTDAWNGPSTTDLPVDGPASIPDFVADDYWFQTYDRAGCSAIGTSYWFRADVDLGTIATLASVTLQDKFHPGRLTINDGIIVFVNGAPQPVMPDVSSQGSPTYGSGLVRDDTETGWSFDALPIALGALHDGTNEIAILYDERCGDGGLGHLVLDVVPATSGA
jgi:hypothetical protein